MLGRRDTRDAFRKLREATDEDRDGDVQRLEAELKRAREQHRMHDGERFDWKDEIERLEGELERAREEVQRRVAEKLREVRDEAEAIAGERADDRAMKRKADKVKDSAAGLAGKVEGDDETAPISREDRIKGYGEILDDLIDLEEEEHDEIRDALKSRNDALKSASDELWKKYGAWLKRADSLTNNITDPDARARAKEIIKELDSTLRSSPGLGDDVEPTDMDELAEELQELIDDHVADRHINDQDREAEEELDEAREKLREARGEVDEVLGDIDELDEFRDEIAAWLESLGDGDEWEGLRKLLRKKLRQIDRVLEDGNRDKAERLRRFWEEVSLPSGFPVTPEPRRGRGVLVGAVAVGVGLGLLVSQVFGGDEPIPPPIEKIDIAVATTTATATPTASMSETAQDDGSASDASVTATVEPVTDFDYSGVVRPDGPLQITIDSQLADEVTTEQSQLASDSEASGDNTASSPDEAPDETQSGEQPAPAAPVNQTNETADLDDAGSEGSAPSEIDDSKPAVSEPADEVEVESGEGLETSEGAADGEPVSAADDVSNSQDVEISDGGDGEADELSDAEEVVADDEAIAGEDVVSGIETANGPDSVVSAVELSRASSATRQ